MRFENKGNVHVKPVGQIEIRDIFGNKVETLAVNEEKGNVLPLSIRRFQATLDRSWMLTIKSPFDASGNSFDPWQFLPSSPPGRLHSAG